MARTKIHVGLEIGTSKTCMVVGEVRPDATATIIGMGEVQSAGVRKGEIVDQTMARQCVRDAWMMAQDNADVDILSVYVSVTGSHIAGMNNAGAYRLPDDENIITQEHMDYVNESAGEVQLGQDQYALHREMSDYSIDGQDPVSNPEGLSGRTLDVNCHVIHGIKTRIMNTLLCTREVPLEVEDIVFAPLATAQMVLNRQMKEAGALLIDIGGGTTDYVFYKNGQLLASGCIAIGGNTINADIEKLTEQRITRRTADILKRTEGNAFGDVKDKSVAHFTSDLGLHDVSIERGLLNRIIRDRLADALLRVKAKLPPEACKRGSGVQVYLCGGTSLMRGLDGLAKYIFGLPVHQPAPLSSTKTLEYLQDPRYCTPIGLIRYAQRYDEDLYYPASGGLLKRMFSIFRRGK